MISRGSHWYSAAIVQSTPPTSSSTSKSWRSKTSTSLPHHRPGPSGHGTALGRAAEPPYTNRDGQGDQGLHGGQDRKIGDTGCLHERHVRGRCDLLNRRAPRHRQPVSANPRSGGGGTSLNHRQGTVTCRRGDRYGVLLVGATEPVAVKPVNLRPISGDPVFRDRPWEQADGAAPLRWRCESAGEITTSAD